MARFLQLIPHGTKSPLTILLSPASQIFTLEYAPVAALVKYLFYPAEELLDVHWHGHLTGAGIIRGVEQATHWHDQLHYSFILNDERDNGGDWRNTLPRLQHEWLPTAVQAGVKAIAYVFTPKFEHRFASQGFVGAVCPYLAIELFDDLETAVAWLAIQRSSQILGYSAV